MADVNKTGKKIIKKPSKPSTSKKKSVSTPKKDSHKHTTDNSIPEIEYTEKSEESKESYATLGKDLQELLTLANNEYNSARAIAEHKKRRDINSLDATMKEFVGPYLLVGYDLEGAPVEIISAGSVAEYDALVERFRKSMYRFNQNIANQNDKY